MPTPPWVRHRNRRQRRVILVACVTLVLLVGFLVFLQSQRTSLIHTASSGPATSGAVSQIREGDVDRDLPNMNLTPGLAVTEDENLVCQHGYAERVRPKGVLWRHLKEAAFARYGIAYQDRDTIGATGVRAPEYQVDHLIPLEIGGSPTDLQNIWPQPIRPALRKDRIENELRELVCSGRMPLKQAQDAIAHNWKTAAPSGQ